MEVDGRATHGLPHKCSPGWLSGLARPRATPGGVRSGHPSRGLIAQSPPQSHAEPAGATPPEASLGGKGRGAHGVRPKATSVPTARKRGACFKACPCYGSSGIAIVPEARGNAPTGRATNARAWAAARIDGRGITAFRAGHPAAPVGGMNTNVKVHNGGKPRLLVDFPCLPRQAWRGPAL